jgi:hypothetical protein
MQIREVVKSITIRTYFKEYIGSKLFIFNFKRNLISKDTFMHFSFIDNLCTFEYNHLIGLGVEGWKGTSQRGR